MANTSQDPIVSQASSWLQSSGLLKGATPINQPPASQSNAWDSYDQAVKPVDAPVTPATPAVAPQGGLLGSVKGFGNSIADAIYAPTATDIATKNSASHSADIQTLSDHSKLLKSQGKDTTHTDALIKTIMAENPSAYGGNLADIIPSVNKTTEQIAGEASGVLADTLGLSGGLSSATYFGAKAGAKAMESNKTADNAVLDTVKGAIIGKVLEVGFNAVAPTISKALEKYGTPLFDAISSHIPDGVKASMQAIADGAQTVADKATLGSGTGGTDVLNAVNDAVDVPFKMLSTIGNGIKDTAIGLKDAIQSKISASSTPKNLPSSIDRLNTMSKDSTTGVANPLDEYNKYVAQESALKLDAKQGDALSVVGKTDYSQAITNVIQQRRDAGAIMGSEMAKLGTTPTDITDVLLNFETNLAKSGITIDTLESGAPSVVASSTSKITQQDVEILNDYVNKLDALGNTPTASELDAFLSRVPKELNVYKQANNIIGTTDAERIIQQNLRDLGTQLTPDVNPVFQAFADAKAKYADLSQFLTDNKGFIGKQNADGTFVKDVSVMKSAIKSALNGGKKDFLLKLEDISGVPVVDKAVLALQAMKDSGNAQGESLLNILKDNPSGSGIPSSLGDVKNWAVKTAKNIVVGSPIEQTQRVIQDTIDKGISAPVASAVAPVIDPASPIANDAVKAFSNPATSPLATSQYGILTAENPMNQTLTPEANKVLNDKLVAKLQADGFNPIPVTGNYGKGAENSFLVPDMTNAQALDYGKLFNQESVLTPKGYIYQNGTYHPADLTNINFDPTQTQFFSQVNVGGQDVKFSIPINFDKTLTLPPK